MAGGQSLTSYLAGQSDEWLKGNVANVTTHGLDNALGANGFGYLTEKGDIWGSSKHLNRTETSNALFAESNKRFLNKQGQILATAQNARTAGRALATTSNNERKPTSAVTTQARPTTISGLPPPKSAYAATPNTNQMGGALGSALKTLLGS